MSSTWLCSRNDLIANVGVLAAAGGGYMLTSRWPDIGIGVVIAGLFLSSAFSVIRQSFSALRAPVSARPRTGKPIPIPVRDVQSKKL
ncbi:MAG: hypothetical protein ACYCY1_17115 [Sulfuriferula sp.]